MDLIVLCGKVFGGCQCDVFVCVGVVPQDAIDGFVSFADMFAPLYGVGEEVSEFSHDDGAVLQIRCAEECADDRIEISGVVCDGFRGVGIAFALVPEDAVDDACAFCLLRLEDCVVEEESARLPVMIEIRASVGAWNEADFTVREVGDVVECETWSQ